MAAGTSTRVGVLLDLEVFGEMLTWAEEVVVLVMAARVPHRLRAPRARLGVTSKRVTVRTSERNGDLLLVEVVTAVLDALRAGVAVPLKMMGLIWIRLPQASQRLSRSLPLLCELLQWRGELLQLETLFLRNMMVDEEDVVLVGEALSGHPSIRQLDLLGKLAPPGPLLHVLPTMVSLERVFLDLSAWTVVQVSSALRALAECDRIKSLTLVGTWEQHNDEAVADALGELLVHEPLRLYVFIEAPEQAIEAAIDRHGGVRDLVENGWVHLFALGADGAVRRYRGSAGAGGARWMLEPLQ